MAEQPAILRGDNGAAVRLALGVLLGLVALQAALLIFLPKGQIVGDGHSEPSTPAPVAAPVPAPAAIVPGLPPSPPLSAAPSSSLSTSLPPPPGQLLGTAPASLPPPPSALSGSQRPIKPSALPPSPSGMQSPSLAVRPSPATPAPAPLPAPQPVTTAPVSATGDPDVDAILAEAKETMSLNDPTATRAALEALQRADLRMPEHPVILREMALAYRKLGETSVADTLFERSNRTAPRSAPQTAPAAPFAPSASAPTTTPAAPPPSGLDAAFAPPTAAPQVASGPLKLGTNKVSQDLTCTTGEKHILRLEIQAAPGSVISPEDINIDVFFYDSVDGQRAELSKCDKPVWDFELPFDFAQGGVEHVNITYHMPKMNESEVREHGLRKYHGYVAKLHYKGQFLGSAAEPRALLNNPTGSPEATLPVNP